MSTYHPTEYPPETSSDRADPLTRIPRAARARLLLHDLETDPCFAAILYEALPDEAARLAYLNHLAWQPRS
ncbi:MAG: hypothetical protein IAF00_10585 [Phycisphaerales bacterium]|nr:hypothetical protein [Phycisphaerales bacterium]